MSEATARERVASAVLLLDDRGHVFLVERAPELRFFGGYWALPGGVRGPEDGPDDPERGDAPALARCAARELFEETGVALLPGARSAAAEAREAVRRALLADDPTAWRAWADRSTPELRTVCRIRTPPFAPVLYDTLFFLAHLPPGEQPNVREGELVRGAFFAPEEALAAWRRGEMEIVPPVLILLELLAGSDVEEFVRRADAIAETYRQGTLHRVRFSPGILMASLRTPTLPPATTTNTLIVGEERLFVVDPATPHADEQARLFALLDELRAEGRELAGILATHHHADHVGAVAATSRRFDLPVHAHPLTLERLDQDLPRTHPIEDGMAFDLGRAPDGSPGWQLRAVFTPGHDRGHLCFRESRYAALCAGDMLSTVSTIVIDPPEGHLATYLRSLERLLAEPMGTLYPAHGPAIRDGHTLVRRYLRHRQQRETALLQALVDGPTTARALVPKVYWDTDPRMHALAHRSLLAGLEKLEEEGRALRESDHWRLVEGS